MNGQPMIAFTAPVRIESEMNRRDHWTGRRKRFIQQHRDTSLVWLGYRAAKRASVDATLMAIHSSKEIIVTLTRIAPRRLDTDNLASGFKGVRDFIAQTILFENDGSERIDWRYHQERGKPKEYSVRIEIIANELRPKGLS